MYYIAALGPFGLPELLLLAMIAMLLFGAKLLPKLAHGTGESVKEQAAKIADAPQHSGRQIRD